jgi:hypothetical protein
MSGIFLALTYVCLAVLGVSVIAVIIFGGSLAIARIRNLVSSTRGDFTAHLGSEFVADAKLTLALIAAFLSFAGLVFFSILAAITS